jgi:hypothetical protein
MPKVTLVHRTASPASRSTQGDFTAPCDGPHRIAGAPSVTIRDMSEKLRIPRDGHITYILSHARISVEGSLHTAHCAFCSFSIASQVPANVLRKLITHKCEAASYPSS